MNCVDLLNSQNLTSFYIFRKSLSMKNKPLMINDWRPGNLNEIANEDLRCINYFSKQGLARYSKILNIYNLISQISNPPRRTGLQLKKQFLRDKFIYQLRGLRRTSFVPTTLLIPIPH